jgi:NAD(P)-dependent dehydrogenase (short-subunit alcohol dehydrogenase family)
VLAACRKPDDVERMNGLGFTGVLLDMDSPESVERAADEVIALTDNRLYGLFNNAGYGVYGPLDTSPRNAGETVFDQLLRRASAHHASAPAMLPHGEGRIVMTSSVMGLISTPAAAPTPPANMRWRPGPTPCAWSCATAALRSA